MGYAKDMPIKTSLVRSGTVFVTIVESMTTPLGDRLYRLRVQNREVHRLEPSLGLRMGGAARDTRCNLGCGCCRCSVTLMSHGYAVPF